MRNSSNRCRSLSSHQIRVEENWGPTHRMDPNKMTIMRGWIFLGSLARITNSNNKTRCSSSNSNSLDFNEISPCKNTIGVDQQAQGLEMLSLARPCSTNSLLSEVDSRKLVTLSQNSKRRSRGSKGNTESTWICRKSKRLTKISTSLPDTKVEDPRVVHSHQTRVLGALSHRAKALKTKPI